MKLLHTSDWHLGHVLYGYDRTDEQRRMLDRLAQIVAQEQPQLMLVCGDIYHHSNPSATTQRLLTDGLLAIRQACPTMTIVVTAGNHDSPARFDARCSLWQQAGVNVVGGIGRTDDGLIDWNQLLIAVKDNGGQTVGLVAAVPHVYPMNFPDTAADDLESGMYAEQGDDHDDTDCTKVFNDPDSTHDHSDSTEVINDLDSADGHNDPDSNDSADTTPYPRAQRMERFFHSLLHQAQQRNRQQLPLVMTAHLAVGGSSSRGHDEGAGGMEWVELDELGTGYDYLALGHIHCPQNVPHSHGRARYCGTPLAVSFDEDYQHSVTIAEVEHGQKPALRTVELTPRMPLITLPNEPMPWEQALDALTQLPPDTRAYIRLQALTQGTYLPGDCMEQARAALQGKQTRLCLVKPVHNPTADKTTDDDDKLHDLSIEQLQHTSPLEVAQRYYLEHEGLPMSDELKEMMEEAIRSMNNEQ